MEENADSVSDVVFSVMEEIFSSCVHKQDEESVPVSTLVEYMRPHMSHYPTGISDIQTLLDPNNENPSVSKQVFYQAMQKWIGMVKEYESNSVRSSDSEQKCFPFSQSTPTQSSSEENISNILNISTVSPTSFDGDKSNSSVERDMQLLKQQLKTLNIAHSSTLNELSIVKSQLTTNEQLVVSLREDLDRTNRRLLHEQQVNSELQKYLENKDDSRDEKNDATKKINDLQKVLASIKKENSSLVSTLKTLEVQVEEKELLIIELLRKEDLRLRELAKLQSSLKEYEEENKTLTTQLKQIEEQFVEQKNKAQHHLEVSEIYKDEIEILRAAIKKSDKRKTRNSLPAICGIDANDHVNMLENNLSGVIEDSFDVSADSEVESSREQNLFSELQACTFMNNCNKCFINNEESSKIIKEHENCPKLFQEYREQIEMFTKKLETATIEHDNLLAQYQNMEREILEKTSLKNQELSEEISNLRQQLDCFNITLGERENELIEMRNFEIKYNEISEEIERIKSEQENGCLEYENLQKKHDSLTHEKETLQKFLEEIKSENNILTIKLNDSNNTVVLKDEEICSLRLQKALLDQEIINLQNEQEKNSLEIETFAEKLKYFNDIGKKNVQTVKTKILNLDTKVQFLNAVIDKSSQSIEELRGENNMIRNKLKLLQPLEDSSSTDDSRSERPEFRKKLKKRTDHELQFKINKFEDHVNFLERQLSAEKLKLSRIGDLEARINDLKREKNAMEDEKRDVSKRLKETQDELWCKEQRFEEMRRQNDSLNAVNEKLGENENELRGQIEKLEMCLVECRKENHKLSVDVEKQRSKVSLLLEAKSDVERLTKETRSVRSLVQEKDSVIKFKNNQLMKSNSSLDLAEKRVLSLELLLSKANMVLTGTVTDVFRATKMVYESWKLFLERNSDEQLIQNLESLDVKDRSAQDLTEEEIWIVHNQLNVTSQLLETLAKTNRDEHGLSSKNISKFTMKNELFRFPSRDPDISSSIKEEDTSASFDEDITETIHDMVTINSSDSTLSHRGNIREALSDRKIIEKKFWLLATSWKTDCEIAKNNYASSKRQCLQLRESFQLSLLKIVTCIKEHKCYREQKSLIRALMYVEKLKDVLADVFKMAEQNGASRQELRMAKCWNLVLDYVKGCTSVQMLKDLQVQERSNAIGSTNCKSLVIRTTRPEAGRKFRSIMICLCLSLIFGVICLIGMAVLYLQLECIRQTKASTCPLDTLVMMTNTEQDFSPH